MKMYVPDMKFVMMLLISLLVITVGGAALGRSEPIRRYLGVGL